METYTKQDIYLKDVILAPVSTDGREDPGLNIKKKLHKPSRAS